MNERAHLYVCATPIGNLEDASPRLRRVLSEAALIAAEDTRQTRRLLQHFGIHVPMLSCREHNEQVQAAEIIAHLEAGKSVAYVSDAGTPGIADPGARLVAAVLDAGFDAIPVPGPSSVTAALSVCGIPADAFLFLGFLPRRGRRREAALDELAGSRVPVVLFESPHRIRETLDDLVEAVEGRWVWVGRELTKRYESHYRGPVERVRDEVTRDPLRGEYTLVVAPAEAAPAATEAERAAGALPLRAEVSLLVEAGMPEREAIRRVSRAHGIPRRTVYQAVKVGQ